MKVRIYPGGNAWWLVQRSNQGMYMSPNGEWRNWVQNMRHFDQVRNSPKALKKDFINSRRLAIAVAKKYIPNVEIFE